MVKQCPHLQQFDIGMALWKAHNHLAGRTPAKLQSRIDDHARGTTSNDSKVKGRWAAGGFHKPGSNKK